MRISGEDSGRGTFSHRHAVLHDQNRERWDQGNYVPLRHLSDNQAEFLVIDSILNEGRAGVQYGFATAAPDELVVWEAQFGDFANGAQVVIDQFLSSGEAKWGRDLPGLVMLLPHDCEARVPSILRQLQLFYIQCRPSSQQHGVCQTTAAQIFPPAASRHFARCTKPLIVAVKSPCCATGRDQFALEELAGTFRR